MVLHINSDLSIKACFFFLLEKGCYAPLLFLLAAVSVIMLCQAVCV